MNLDEGLSTVPDQESSTRAYAARFSGAVGHWLLAVQDEATRVCLEGVRGAVLEPGGAHGQNIAVLKALGLRHEILSSPGCTREMIQTALDAGTVTLSEGSFEHFPQGNRSVEVVLSYRMLAHIRDWPRYLAEMCRVADRRVVVDYPTLRSFNILTESLYKLKKGVEQNTRPYRIFAEAELVKAFAEQGFKPVHRVGQFFWPMALHRGLGKPGLSKALETTAGAVGLRHLFGSPVICAFDRL